MKRLKNYYTKVNKAASKFTRWEWMSFELSVMAFTLMLISLLPALLIVPVWAYFIIFIVIYTYFLRRVFPKIENLKIKGFVPRFSTIAHEFKYFDWATYKISVMAFTLMLASFIPALAELHWSIYLVVFVALIIYLFAHIFNKK